MECPGLRVKDIDFGYKQIIYKTDKWIKLKPANKKLKPKKYDSGNILVLGVLTGLIRKY